jgi:hypothetical protein
MFAGLVAEMKAANDWSEDRFAQYESNWQNSFIGDDNIPQMCVMFRDGTFSELWKALDGAASAAITKKFTNHPYSEILPAIVPPMAPFLAKAVGLVSPLAPLVKTNQHALEKVAALMQVAEKIKD